MSSGQTWDLEKGYTYSKEMTDSLREALKSGIDEQYEMTDGLTKMLESNPPRPEVNTGGFIVPKEKAEDMERRFGDAVEKAKVSAEEWAKMTEAGYTDSKEKATMAVQVWETDSLGGMIFPCDFGDPEACVAAYKAAIDEANRVLNEGQVFEIRAKLYPYDDRFIDYGRTLLKKEDAMKEWGIAVITNYEMQDKHFVVYDMDAGKTSELGYVLLARLPAQKEKSAKSE